MSALIITRPFPNLNEYEELCSPPCDPPLQCGCCGWIATIRNYGTPVYRPMLMCPPPRPGSKSLELSICEWCAERKAAG